MESLMHLEQAFTRLFRMDEWESDPGFSRFIPMVYDPIGFDWRRFFEAEFVRRFNGLMLKGREQVHTVFLAVFPTEEVLKRFLDESAPGDLLFMHHPLLMECGDPRGRWGRGFVPIGQDLLLALKEKELSVFTCHLPMDTSWPLGTGGAIMEALQAEPIKPFCPAGNGHVGMICRVTATDTRSLIDRLITLFDIPYVDFEGKERARIERIAILPGCGDVAAMMREAEASGADAYVTGEIHCHIDNEYGRTNYAAVMAYAAETSMSLIGVSHAASEYLVMKTQVKPWLEERFSVNVTLLPQSRWWW
ncbi:MULTISPECIES: Nif3-like dinuclear metal center hexameric protein [Brevibacillus]|jgi:putative NIF3 family GTP cyclohydrolase 1 type 2|uniref:GTP cyclohydrolase 1 type 2 homolog n=1 Tax=Brevibacillus aydinogluensis TaxID=927786 RepID=A0AA48MAL0_9BACL|nr:MULTISPECIES: Nif3-like dinuclear metal center hexameric protein [Bacillales]MBR8661717.1 Nif3-like dinuclear metal center hexameric protein [Brevibacillus sp. NL20B1]MDT3418112.1 putative NIF3 family GTP cyclohydrolase 1 type 2 [Brevibacillus aydinogluensis]UFJ62542.1 Nif3-like dinuclear metal center hexameric protein [Anoxybacillus sediminis]CAJ1004342.1 GTP cyclohydrolase 1 type 2-like protein [Brevibacillus aydinogluensis]